AVDPNHNVIAVGEPAIVLVRRAGTDRFEPAPNIDAQADIVFLRAIATGDPQRAHVIGDNRGRFLTGNAINGAWSVFTRPDRFHDTRVFGLSTIDEGADLWAVGPVGAVLRKTNSDEWTLLAPQVPPRYFPCTSPDTPFQISKDIRGVGLDSTNAYVT